MEVWIYISMIVIVFAARFVADKLLDTTSTKVKWAMVGILLVLYTVFLEGFTYLMLRQPIVNDNFYQSMIVGIALINFSILLIIVFYYFVRKKRKLSDVDKMRLKDL